MPALLLCVAGLVFSRGALSRPEPSAADFPDLLSVVLYVGMNTFLSMPVLCELGAHAKSGGGFLCAASAFVIAASVGLVLSAVCSDKNSYPYDLPLAYVLGGSRLFSALASGGMLTTLVSSFYPLYAPAGKNGAREGKLSWSSRRNSARSSVSEASSRSFTPCSARSARSPAPSPRGAGCADCAARESVGKK